MIGNREWGVGDRSVHVHVHVLVLVLEQVWMEVFSFQCSVARHREKETPLSRPAGEGPGVRA